MLVKNFLRCAVVFVVAFTVTMPLPALAEALNAKVGAWEMTTTTSLTGMPVPAEALASMPAEQRAKMEKVMQERAAKPSVHLTKSCVTKADLDQDRVIKEGDDAQCTRKILSRSASKIVLEETCTGAGASKATMTIEARTPESLVAAIDMTHAGAHGKVHVDIKGRWLGSSCAGIEADE